MNYTNAEHLREQLPREGRAEEPSHYCPDCGERIEAEHAPCANCEEQGERLQLTNTRGDVLTLTAPTTGESWNGYPVPVLNAAQARAVGAHIGEELQPGGRPGSRAVPEVTARVPRRTDQRQAVTETGGTE